MGLASCWATLVCTLGPIGPSTSAVRRPDPGADLWSVSTFFQNLLFLQTISAPRFGSNTALWSLANEFWYYLLFPLGCLLLLPGRRARVRMLAAVMVLGLVSFIPPTMLLLGVVWLFGYAALLVNDLRWVRAVAARRPALFFSGLVLLGILAACKARLVSEFAGLVLVGVGFALLLVCLVNAGSVFRRIGVRGSRLGIHDPSQHG